MTVLPQHLSKPLFHYEQYLHGRVQAQTRIAYGNVVWRFLKLFEDRKGLIEFSPADFHRYRALRRGEGIARQTINDEIATIRRFFAWTSENNESVAVNPAWRRRKPTRRQRPAKSSASVAA